jgi:hypothetical protein
MPSREQRDHQKDMEQEQRETLNAFIGEQVIHVLGEPSGFYKIHVRRLWQDRFRVNILVGGNATIVTRAATLTSASTRRLPAASASKPTRNRFVVPPSDGWPANRLKAELPAPETGIQTQ